MPHTQKRCTITLAKKKKADPKKKNNDSNSDNIKTNTPTRVSGSRSSQRSRIIPSQRSISAKYRSAARTAYMLIYVRKEIATDMFCALNEKEIPASLRVCCMCVCCVCVCALYVCVCVHIYVCVCVCSCFDYTQFDCCFYYCIY